jgi:uncharacterized protein (DUF1697 family)
VNKTRSNTVHVALLRAINVAGHNAVAMTDLRALFSALDFAEVQSLLQSGNLVFSCPARSAAALETLLEKESAKRLKLTADYLVRTAAELQKIVARNPFPQEAQSDPGHLVVVFLKTAPAAKSVEALRAAIKGRETLHCDGRQLYIHYPDGIGRSKLTAALIERTHATRGTARNWNTVTKLLALC